jgi:hypothetical protein
MPEINLGSTVKYSYCETITASATTPWHIRQLTKKGQMFGGGADTLALCGCKVAWDLVSTCANLSHVCRRCAELFVEAGGSQCLS